MVKCLLYGGFGLWAELYCVLGDCFFCDVSLLDSEIECVKHEQFEASQLSFKLHKQVSHS